MASAMTSGSSDHPTCFHPIISPFKPNECTPLLHAEVEPFSFFQLPKEIVFKILKEYVSVTDKERILQHIAEFKPYLDLDSLWFTSTRILFQLANHFPPGWYIHLNDLHTRYYVAMNTDHLTLTIYIFRSQIDNTPEWVHLALNRMPFSEMKTKVRGFLEGKKLLKIEENNVLYYQYKTRKPFHYNSFWIFKKEKTVRWSNDDTVYPLINNKCYILNKTHSLVLTLHKKCRVEVKCLRNTLLGHPPQCSCPQYKEKLLLPCRFEVCLHSNPFKHCFDEPDTCCQSVQDQKNSKQKIHVNMKQTYVNPHQEDSSLLIELYYDFFERDYYQHV